jgi:hypothetical protein
MSKTTSWYCRFSPAMYGSNTFCMLRAGDPLGLTPPRMKLRMRMGELHICERLVSSICPLMVAWTVSISVPWASSNPCCKVHLEV